MRKRSKPEGLNQKPKQDYSELTPRYYALSHENRRMSFLLQGYLDGLNVHLSEDASYLLAFSKWENKPSLIDEAEWQSDLIELEIIISQIEGQK